MFSTTRTEECSSLETSHRDGCNDNVNAQNNDLLPIAPVISIDSCQSCHNEDYVDGHCKIINSSFLEADKCHAKTSNSYTIHNGGNASSSSVILVGDDEDCSFKDAYSDFYHNEESESEIVLKGEELLSSGDSFNDLTDDDDDVHHRHIPVNIAKKENVEEINEEKNESVLPMEQTSSLSQSSTKLSQPLPPLTLTSTSTSTMPPAWSSISSCSVSMMGGSSSSRSPRTTVQKSFMRKHPPKSPRSEPHSKSLSALPPVECTSSIASSSSSTNRFHYQQQQQQQQQQRQRQQQQQLYQPLHPIYSRINYNSSAEASNRIQQRVSLLRSSSYSGGGGGDSFGLTTAVDYTQQQKDMISPTSTANNTSNPKACLSDLVGNNNNRNNHDIVDALVDRITDLELKLSTLSRLLTVQQRQNSLSPLSSSCPLTMHQNTSISHQTHHMQMQQQQQEQQQEQHLRHHRRTNTAPPRRATWAGAGGRFEVGNGLINTQNGLEIECTGLAALVPGLASQSPNGGGRLSQPVDAATDVTAQQLPPPPPPLPPSLLDDIEDERGDGHDINPLNFDGKTYHNNYHINQDDYSQSICYEHVPILEANEPMDLRHHILSNSFVYQQQDQDDSKIESRRYHNDRNKNLSLLFLYGGNEVEYEQKRFHDDSLLMSMTQAERQWLGPQIYNCMMVRSSATNSSNQTPTISDDEEEMDENRDHATKTTTTATSHTDEDNFSSSENTANYVEIEMEKTGKPCKIPYDDIQQQKDNNGVVPRNVMTAQHARQQEKTDTHHLNNLTQLFQIPPDVKSNNGTHNRFKYDGNQCIHNHNTVDNNDRSSHQLDRERYSISANTEASPIQLRETIANAGTSISKAELLKGTNGSTHDNPSHENPSPIRLRETIGDGVTIYPNVLSRTEKQKGNNNSNSSGALLSKSRGFAFQQSDNDVVRIKWLEYLNSFQESTQDVDAQMEEFIKVPGRVENVLGFGFLICIDSFLYMCTILPIRFVWNCFLLMLHAIQVVVCLGERKLYRNYPHLQFHRQHTYQIIQVLITYTVYRYVLCPISIGKLYHWIRGQSMIKIYVLIAMVETFDRLFSALGQDCLDSMYWNTVSRPRSIRMLISVAVVLVYVSLHTLILFVHISTLNVAINSADQALLTLLITGNFAEIKSTVFKKYNKAALFKITAADICERFKLALFLSLILILNVCQVMDRMQLMDYIRICCIVWAGELVSDWIKHSFITKFNFLPSSVYPEYALILAGDVTGFGHENIHLDHSHAVVKRIGFAQIPLIAVMFRFVQEAYKYASRNNAAIHEWVLYLNEMRKIHQNLMETQKLRVSVPYGDRIALLSYYLYMFVMEGGLYIVLWFGLLIIKLTLGSSLQYISRRKLRLAPDLLSSSMSSNSHRQPKLRGSTGSQNSNATPGKVKTN